MVHRLVKARAKDKMSEPWRQGLYREVKSISKEQMSQRFGQFRYGLLEARVEIKMCEGLRELVHHPIK